MSTAPLDLKIAVIGVNKLDKLVKRMDVLETEVARLNKSLPRASNNIKKIGTSSAGAARQTSAFAKAVGGLATAFASIQIGAGFAEAVKDARALELSGRRLKLLTAEYKQYNGVQKQAERLAAKFQVSVADSSKALFSLGSRLGAQGTTLDEIVSVYEGLNSALIVTGRSAQEAASANYQLSQALGSGKLTGDELRTIVETLPELLNEIAKQAGKSATQIRQMAKDGELTTDIIIKATKALGEKYSDAVDKSITVNQKFNNSIQSVSEKIGKSLLPVIDPLQLALIDFFNVVAKLPDPLVAVGTAAVAAAVGIGALQLSLSLLGLPGVIALFGKLSIALAGVYGATTTAVTGFTVAGAAIKATTLVVTTQTVALGALKLAFLAIPYAAIAAGLYVIVKAFTDGIDKAKEWAKVLRDSGAKELQSELVSLNNEKKKLLKTLQKLKDSPYYRGMKGDIAEIEKAVKELDLKIDEATRRRKLIVEIETILGNKGVNVQSLRDGFYGPGGSSGAQDIDDPIIPTGGDEEGSAPRASDAPQLQRDLQLKKDLLGIDRAILEAQLAGNTAAIELGKLERIQVEFAKTKADILASERYEDEKKLEIKNAQLEVEDALQQLEFTGLELAKQKKEALAETLQPIQDEIKLLRGKLAGNEEEIRQLIEIRDLKKQIAENGGDPSQAEGLVKTRDELAKQAEAAEELKAQYKALAEGIAGELTGAFKSIITGAKSAEEALSDAFAGIADAFLDMAMKMIAEWLVMKALGMMFPGGGSSGGSGGDIFSDIASRGGLAEGGYVTGPTNALIGEGGEPEYVIPASKMDGAMQRYSAGASGSSVIEGSAETPGQTGGVAVADAPMSINISGGVTQMGGENYIKQEQLPSIISQASKAGEARALRRLQMSPSARRKVGL